MKTVRRSTTSACYPSSERKPFEVLGYILIGVGVILLFLCIPGWAWVALIGVVMVVLGYFLVKISKAWR
ncbi:MAG: hypothetical protein EOM69_06185 [Clostridia bacterium]|nr:hypothetical protein [Clostridia bacterium]